MSYYANRRIEKLRESLKGLPPVYEMTWAEKLNYYCTLSRIDELERAMNSKNENFTKSVNAYEFSEKTMKALETLWKRSNDNVQGK